MPAQAERAIVIVGGGSAGWMAAAALSRFLPRTWSVTLVESDAIGTVGVGEATIPGIRLFNASLGIDEDAFLAATGGTYKLGIAFEGWGAPGERYLHAFGAIGRALGPIDFFPYWQRARATGGGGSLWSHMPAAIAADAGRGGRPAEPRGIAWAYHFDAARYAAFLRTRAESQGVVRREGRIVDVERRGDTVLSLRLENGARIAGDLFLDCSGFAALLVGERSGWIGYDRWLPCDRGLAVPTEAVAPRPAYTRAIAHDAGWQWRIPLRHRTGNGLVYSSAHLSDDAAAATLLANLDGEPLAEPRPIRFATGRRAEQWVGNTVALGLSAGFLEPLESTSIHLIQQGIAELIALLPADPDAPPERAAFNRRMATEFDRVRDFIVLHYHLNRRDGAMWRAAREMALPDTLAERLALFRASGRIVRDGEELFAPAAWQQVMTGQGVVPAAYHPLADAPSPADLAEFLRLTALDARRQAEALPPHDTFLARLPRPQPETVR